MTDKDKIRDRNRRIVFMRGRGRTTADLSIIFGLSEKRIRTIVREHDQEKVGSAGRVR